MEGLCCFIEKIISFPGTTYMEILALAAVNNVIRLIECRLNGYIHTYLVCEQRTIDIGSVIALEWYKCESSAVFLLIIGVREHHISSHLVFANQKIVH